MGERKKETLLRDVDEDKAIWLIFKKYNAMCVCMNTYNFPFSQYSLNWPPNPSLSLCTMNEALDLYCVKQNPSLCTHSSVFSLISL